MRVFVTCEFGYFLFVSKNSKKHTDMRVFAVCQFGYFLFVWKHSKE